uniref:Uncharacterized protein n=1 Tax=Anguilla anguilla TaxID=7936 RepID=A0A0E9Q2G7_ANGAN
MDVDDDVVVPTVGCMCRGLKRPACCACWWCLLDIKKF